MANSAFTHDPQITVPGSSTDNAIVIFDGTAGTGFGNSTIVVDSGGNGRIGIAADTNVITLTSGVVTIAGTVAATTLTGAGAGITALAAGNITASGTLPALNGAALTALTAANITASGTLPALNGAALTALNGTQVTSGTVPVAQLGSSGTRSSSTFLNGANAWAAAGGAADDYFAASGLSTKDLGTGLHIKTGDAGSTTIASGGGELVIEGGSGNHGMSILGSGDGGSYIYLGDAAAPSRAGIIYSHGDDHLVLRSGDATRVTVESSGRVVIPVDIQLGSSSATSGSDTAQQITMKGRVGVHAYRSSTVSIAADSNVTINFTSAVWDSDNMFDVGANPERLTIRTAGLYYIQASVGMSSDSGYRRVNIYDNNGVSLAQVRYEGSIGAGDIINQLSILAYLATNSYIYLAVFQNSGGNLTIQPYGTYGTSLMALKVA